MGPNHDRGGASKLRVSVDGGIYYHEAYGRRWPCISVERDDPFFEFRWTIVLKCTLVRAESRCCATEKPVDPIVTANKKPAVWLPQCPWIFNYFPRPASTKPTVSTYWSESTQTEDRGWRNDVEEDFDDDELSEWEDITDDEDILDGGCFIDDDAEALDDDSGAFETVLSLPCMAWETRQGCRFLKLDNPPSETRRHSSASIPGTLSLWSREAVDLDKHSLMTTTVSSDRSALIGSATVPAQTPRLRVCVVGPALRHLSQSLILAGVSYSQDRFFPTKPLLSLLTKILCSFLPICSSSGIIRFLRNPRFRKRSLQSRPPSRVSTMTK